MLACGGIMMLVGSVGVFLIFKKKPYPTLFLKSLVAFTFLGWIATVSGWYTTEIGRQPWLVQGVLKSADAVTDVAPENIALSLILYLVVYVFLLFAYITTVFYLARKESKSPIPNK